MSYDPVAPARWGSTRPGSSCSSGRVQLEVDQGRSRRRRWPWRATAGSSRSRRSATRARDALHPAVGRPDDRGRNRLEAAGRRTARASTSGSATSIPEFATNGKDVVTVEQVLTHTAGFPFAPLGYPKMLDRSQRLEAFARWRLDWEPGSRLQFHLTGAAWVIAELVERRTGLPFADYLRTRSSSRSVSASCSRCPPTGTTSWWPCRSPSTGPATTRRSTRGDPGTWPRRGARRRRAESLDRRDGR